MDNAGKNSFVRRPLQIACQAAPVIKGSYFDKGDWNIQGRSEGEQPRWNEWNKEESRATKMSPIHFMLHSSVRAKKKY